MNMTTNKIYDYIERYVNTTDRPVYCASVLEPIPSQYPACFIREVNRYREVGNIDLKFTDKQHRSVWNVMVFTNANNGAMSTAHEIMEDAEEAFNALGFIETSMQPENTANPTEYRLTARFERLVCDDDRMPTS